MRFVSWNVNGLRAVLKKEAFYPTFDSFGADLFALQETKMHEGQAEVELPGYYQTWSSAEKKGYAGTAVFSREQPLRALHSLGIPTGTVAREGSVLDDPAQMDKEGRICALEFEKFWFVNCYTPNSKDELKRLPMRLIWGKAFREFLTDLAKSKPVIACGDLNVAHEEIDLKNPKTNHFNAGFSDEERDDFSQLLAAGFTDSFRYLHPDLADAYSWWSFRGNARANNTGWRIDYFIVSDILIPLIEAAAIWPEVQGSDHVPVSLDLNI